MKEKFLAIFGVFALFYFTGCFGGGRKLKREYNTKEELQQDIVNAVSEQYGMQFEIGKGLDGSKATMALGWDYGFYGNLRPVDYSEEYKKYNLYTDYTVCNETGTFKTQAHVRMFEKQLKADVEKILDDIGMKYDILEFRGMSRNINKWSKDSSYEEYKRTNDFETWIYIKLPKQEKMGLENNRKYYAPIVLPMVKKLYSALEPEYNVTLQFYLDEYDKGMIHTNENNNDWDNLVHKVEKNPVLVCLDLSKFNNYLDWTEHDIESEIASIHEEPFITAWKKANGLE